MFKILLYFLNIMLMTETIYYKYIIEKGKRNNCNFIIYYDNSDTIDSI